MYPIRVNCTLRDDWKIEFTFVFAHSFHFIPEGDTTTVHWLFIRLKGLQYTYLSILNTKEAFTMSGKIILETPRLLLREYVPEDFNALYEILSDPETMRHYPAPFDARRVKGWIDWNLQNYAEYGFGLWAVGRKESGAFIGDCGITLQNIDGEMLPEIGYHIHKNCWRHGYGTEAARAVRDWAFEALTLKEIEAALSSDLTSMSPPKKAPFGCLFWWRQQDSSLFICNSPVGCCPPAARRWRLHCFFESCCLLPEAS